MIKLSRRHLLASGLAAPFVARSAMPARAEAPMMGASFATHRRFKIGDFEVTTILAGTTPREEPQGIFGMNVPAEEFNAVSEANFLSTDVAQFYFTPTLVNTGAELILFDTGLNAAATTAAIEGAGYSADQVDIVVLTHMHGDHIGGLMNEGVATFSNARYVAGQVEFDYWAAQDNERFEGMVRPLADQMTFIGDGDDVVTGVNGMAAYGHTPGHMVFRLDSNGAGLVMFVDLANHPVWSLARPEWEVRFDADKEAAAQSRLDVLGMIAAEKLPAIGYHMPFPALGYVDDQVSDAAFKWVPESGQLMG